MRSRLGLHAVLSLVVTTILVAFPCGAQELPLTQTQRTWLSAHPTVVVGIYEDGWPPFEEWNAGEPKGLALDFLNESLHALGVKPEFRAYRSWTGLLDAACNGKVNLIMNVAITAERTECMVFTRQYVRTPAAVVARLRDERVPNSRDLSGLRVVTERGFATEEAAANRYPKAVHVHTDTTVQALMKVANGEADVYLGNAYAAAHLIDAKALVGVGLVRTADMSADSLHFAVPNANRALAEAINTALQAMPESRRDAIELEWLPQLRWSNEKLALLSVAEAIALKTNLRLGFPPRAAPLSFTGEHGEPAGLAAEYLQRFQDLGARLTPVPASSWQGVRDQMATGKVDAAIALVDGPAVNSEWVASQPFVTIPNVIVTRSDAKVSVIGLGDLAGKTVAVSDPDRLVPLISSSARGARFVVVEDALRGLEVVREGKAQAYVGNLAVVDALVRSNFIGELRVAAPAGIEDRLALVARREHAAVVAAFDRMLGSMSPREREAIRGDWLSFEYSQGVNWERVIGWSLPILAVLITIFLIQARNYRQLKAEVNERKKLEVRFAEVTDHLPAVIYQATRTDSGEFMFPFVVGDLSSLFGITAEAAMATGPDVLARVHPDDQARLRDEIDRVMSGSGAMDIEFRALSDRGWRWVRSHSAPYESEGGRRHWTGYWIDVTDQHAQRIDLLSAKAAAEEAAKAKANFLATMSHEIRTPMSGVIGLLEMLAHTNLDAGQRDIVSTMDNSAQMLKQILDDILDFSKMEAGALKLDSTPLRLRGVLEGVVQMLAPISAAKGLRIDSKFDSRIADLHLGDDVRLRQILFNLVSNSIKFTERGRIRVSALLVGSTEAGQVIKLSVADTGIGIPKDRQEKLFKPFSQAEASTSRRYGGTGLGLSICHRIVTLMSGRIRLRSESGKGTVVTVRFSLPVAREEAERGERGPHAGGRLDALRPDARILIAEDHPTNRIIMAWYMERLGLTFDMVANGEEALASLRSSAYDLLITDCLMPVMDGYALAEEVRRREREEGAPRLPILAVTANVYRWEADRCREAGMDGYIAKPVSLVTLSRALARWLAAANSESMADEVASDSSAAGAGAALGVVAQLSARYGSTEIAIAMLRSFAMAAQGDLTILRSAVEGDTQLAVHVLHRLAGALGAIDQSELMEEARGIERRSMDLPNFDLREISDFIEKVDLVVGEVEDALAKEKP